MSTSPPAAPLLPPASLGMRLGRWATFQLSGAALGLFFRETGAFGDEKIPQDGSVIFVCAPHANQFLDPLMVMHHCQRPVGFLTAAVSMRRKVVGMLARAMNSIPVERPQDSAIKGVGSVEGDGVAIHGMGTRFLDDIGKEKDMSIVVKGEPYVVSEVKSDVELILRPPGLPAPLTEPTPYKIQRKIDQSAVYDTVYATLHDGGAVGIFPEGGSHDRTTLLPLKAGFTIMALGALTKYPNLKLRIVPVGLNYFRAHRFRSTAYVEFGDPIEIAPELVDMYQKGGAERRKACADLLEQVDMAIHSVTVQAPSFQVLQLLRLARRLYKPEGVKLTVDQKLQLTRHFAKGLEQLKDRKEVQDITAKIKTYYDILKSFNLRDHQVPKLKVNKMWAFFLLVQRLLLLIMLALVALPGLLFTAPIAILANGFAKRKAIEAVKGSSVKIAGRDVLATWKILVALVLIPFVMLLWVTMVILIFDVFPEQIGITYPVGTELACQTGIPIIFAVVLFPIMYLTVRFVETGVVIVRSLKPLFLSLFGSNAVLSLQRSREQLMQELTVLVEKLGPEALKDFERRRVIPLRVVDFDSPDGMIPLTSTI